MHLIIVPAKDVGYFDENYPVSKMSGLNDTEMRFSINGFHFSGVIRSLNCSPKKVFTEEEIVNIINFTESLSATVVARTISAEEGMDVSSMVSGDSPLAEKENEWLLDEIIDTLETVARFSRRSIAFVTDGLNIVPPNDCERYVKIVMSSPPPGFSQSRMTDTLFGSSVCKKNYQVTLMGPAVDMGVVVKNDLDEAIAQIIDHTIYLFLPQHKSSHQALAQEGDDIFSRTLALAWNVYQAKETLPPSTEIIKSADELSALTPTAEKKRAAIHEAIKEADDDIEAAQRKLRNALSYKRTLVIMLDVTNYQREIDYGEAWARLNDCPLFEKVVKSSDSHAHYFTKPIIVTDESGQNRYLGRFGIRFQSTEEVVVWSLDYPHYSGVPHPHINKQGSVCLGNVSESVWQLLVEDREVEATLLVIQLLSEGYDPTLAEHPLEEWPTVEKFRRRKMS